jgi:uncharacterized protein YkwD
VKALFLLLFVSLWSTATTATPPQRPGQPEIRIPNLERRIHDLINRERKASDLSALQFDERLASIARAHSEDMGRRHFFSHVNPDGRNPTARGKLAGYTCRKVYRGYSTEGLGENIFQGNLYDRVRISGNQRSYDWNTPEDLAKQSVKGWMNSPGHRRNILEKNYMQTGIGVAISKDDKVYVTQVFC